MCQILRRGVLRKCQTTLDVTGYYDACVVDVCAHNGDRKYLIAVNI